MRFLKAAPPGAAFLRPISSPALDLAGFELDVKTPQGYARLACVYDAVIDASSA